MTLHGDFTDRAGDHRDTYEPVLLDARHADRWHRVLLVGLLAILIACVLVIGWRQSHAQLRCTYDRRSGVQTCKSVFR